MTLGTSQAPRKETSLLARCLVAALPMATPPSPGSRLEDTFSVSFLPVCHPSHTSFGAVRVGWQFLVSEA